MQWFNDLKLATKLILAFLVVATIAGIIGFIGTRSVNTVNDMMTDIYGNQLVPINDIGNVRTHGAENYRRLLLLSVIHDAKLADKVRSDYDNSLKTIDEGYKHYMTTVLSPEEAAVVPKLDAAVTKYRELVQQFFRMLDEGRQAEAQTFVSQDLYPVYLDISNHRASLSEIMAKNADATNTASDKIVADIMTLLTGLMIGGFIISLALGLLVTRVIVRQLGGEPAYAADVVKRVAEGDLTVDVQLRNGDNSSLLASMRQMTEKLRAIIGDVRMTADALASASEELSSTSEEMSAQAIQLQEMIQFFRLSEEPGSKMGRLSRPSAPMSKGKSSSPRRPADDEKIDETAFTRY